MYIKGSKWNMSRRRQRSNPFRVILLVFIIAGLFAADRFIVPTVPNLFSATSTPTRPVESYITDAQKLENEGRLTLAINAYKQAVQVDPKNPANYLALTRLYIYNGVIRCVPQAENALLSIQTTIRPWRCAVGP
jgi:tetratricopeptide (TPR) repeat protein